MMREFADWAAHALLGLAFVFVVLASCAWLAGSR